MSDISALWYQDVKLKYSFISSEFVGLIHSWKDTRHRREILYFEENPRNSSHVELVRKACLAQARNIKNVTRRGREEVRIYARKYENVLSKFTAARVSPRESFK